MNHPNHSSTAKMTDAVTHSAALLAALFVSVNVFCKSLNGTDFVKLYSRKECPAHRTLFVRFVSSILNPSFVLRAFQIVQLCMVGLRKYFKVLYRIIKRVSVLVMNYLFREWEKRSAKMSFHNKAVFWDSLLIDLEHSVTALYRTLAIQRTAAISASVSSMSLIMNVAKSIREVFVGAAWYRTIPHVSILTPFDQSRNPFQF